ncbi:MAG: SH3 domain-containing protein [Verrucomicrobiales bacterium]|nr:SH3 domain-containing protein [Verrucomicrobiales bacterium]
MNIRLSQVWAGGALLCLVSIGSATAATLAYSKADRVNVRSRPGYVGEIITQLTRGEEIRVVGTNVLSKPAPDEPATWYKIELPETSPLWVSAEYVDGETKTVRADVLNVRAGPSYDHASVARVKRGTQLHLLGDIRDGWLQVAAPAGAFGFVPGTWVAFDAAGAAAPVVPPATAATPTLAATNAPSAPALPPGAPPKATTNAPAVGLPPSEGASARRDSATVPPPTLVAAPTRPAASSPPPPPKQEPVGTSVPATTAKPEPATAPPASPSVAASATSVPAAIPAATLTQDEPAAAVSAAPAEELVATSQEPAEDQGRRVRREGVVIRPSNLKAPTHFALKSRDSGKTINFLFTTRSLPIHWRDYWGKVVWITGREYLDQRHLWRGIPLLDVENIEAVR